MHNPVMKIELFMIQKFKFLQTIRALTSLTWFLVTYETRSGA
jgi:hypothetical protein